MKVFALKHSRLSIGILAAGLTLGLGFARKPRAQNPEPPYKFTFSDRSIETGIKIVLASGRITQVTGTRGRDTFTFKSLKAGERPKLTGRTGQVLLCAKLKPTDTSRWTFCSYVAGPAGSDTAAREHFKGQIEIESFSWGSGDGGGGGGGVDPDPGDGGGSGGSSGCWEDEELQMSFCNP
jgi:hypothetical protein